MQLDRGGTFLSKDEQTYKEVCYSEVMWEKEKHLHSVKGICGRREELKIDIALFF